MMSRNAEPDTRLDWSAVAELARPVVVAAPAPWELIAHPADPRARLIGYLEAWASMDEAVWREANIRALYDDIMDIFREYPEAETWFNEWRAAHQEARLS